MLNEAVNYAELCSYPLLLQVLLRQRMAPRWHQQASELRKQREESGHTGGNAIGVTVDVAVMYLGMALYESVWQVSDLKQYPYHPVSTLGYSELKRDDSFETL